MPGWKRLLISTTRKHACSTWTRHDMSCQCRLIYRPGTFRYCILHATIRALTLKKICLKAACYSLYSAALIGYNRAQTKILQTPHVRLIAVPLGSLSHPLNRRSFVALSGQRHLRQPSFTPSRKPSGTLSTDHRGTGPSSDIPGKPSSVYWATNASAFTNTPLVK